MHIPQEHLDKLMTDDLVFMTPVGSRLYGLAHEGSDYDYAVVRDCDMRKNKVSIVGELDVRSYSPVLLLDQVFRKPSSVALDALYSRMAIEGPAAEKWLPVLRGYRPNLIQMRQTFLSAALGAAKARDEVQFKRFRLSLKLALHLEEAQRSGGYYDPTLTPEAAEALTLQAEQYFNAYLADPEGYLRALFGEPAGE